MGRSIRPRCVAALLAALAALPAVAAGANLSTAWRLDENAQVRATSPAALLAYRIEPLPAGALRAADALSLPLPEGAIAVERVERADRGAGDFTWVGRRVGADHASVVLTVSPGAINGLIYGDQHVYEISTLRDGTAVLALLDEDAFPECSGGVDPGAQGVPVQAQPAAFQSIALGLPDIEVDVLVLYTPQARDAAGGSVQIRNTAQAAVDASNLAFANSDMVTRFRTAGIYLWNRDESTLGGSSSASLGTLRNDPWVAQLRNATAADLVGLLVEDGQGGCGIGYVMRSPGVGFASNGFQITARGCAVGNLTYAHEHGHNMGFEHDPANGTSPGNASYPWSFGHFHDVGSSTERFRTVMSYSNQCSGGCTRRPYFSNPDIAYMGEPTGIENERDNARTGDDVFAIVRDFRNRATATLLFMDSFE